MSFLNEEPPKANRRRLFLMGLVPVSVLGALLAVVVTNSVESHRDAAVEHAVDYSVEKAEDKFQDATVKLKDKFQDAKDSLKEKFNGLNKSK